MVDMEQELKPENEITDGEKTELVAAETPPADPPPENDAKKEKPKKKLSFDRHVAKSEAKRS